MKQFLTSLKSFETNFNVWFIFITLFFFCLLRIPSLVEPDWYGDEGIYQVMGIAVREGRLLYQGIWDNKPPLLYLLYSFVNGDLFSIRFLSVIFGALAILFLFLLSLKIFKHKFSVFLTTSIFALFFGLPILEGNIANAENFMLAPIILAAFLIFQVNNRMRFYFFSGLLLSTAFLTKIVALFDFAAFFSFLVLLKFYEEFSFSKIRQILSPKRFFSGFKAEIIFVLSFLIPIIATFVYFFFQSALGDYLKAAFSQNVGYVGYGNYFLFPNGLLAIKILGLLVTLLLIFKYRKTLGTPGSFIFIWLAFSIFSALFSQRPYTHYLLVTLPAVCLSLGFIFENKKMILYNAPLFIFSLIILSVSFNLGEKISALPQSFSYYQNYFSFISGQKTLPSYQSFFDRNTSRDYAISDFIKTNTTKDEGVFLWSDSGQIYALTNKLPPGRYIVAYHVTFYKNALEETAKAVDAAKPKFIIATKDPKEIHLLLHYYHFRYEIEGAKIYERNKI
ncbi:MAG: glycosyltransferase family 39 protein [Patescibacteria group bacterium]|nr:glycosyltransferase family 39 protein [Patescibacteria group bacterium]